MNKIVAIAGMGWLGQPLAVHLNSLGYSIRGSVTSLEKATQLQQRGFDAYRVLISENGVHGQTNVLLENADYAIVMIPPGLRRNTGADFVMKMTHLLEEIKRYEVPKVILISSTSVYDDSQGRVTEKIQPMSESLNGRQLRDVEELFINCGDIQTTVVRFGGLMGGSRRPIRYLVGRKDLAGGNAPVNLIHRDDCILIISEILKQDAFGHVFNGVNPEHPKKSDYYIDKAEKLGLEPPSFADSVFHETFKQVDSENLKEILGFEFTRALI